jgi:hypothetical protein
MDSDEWQKTRAEADIAQFKNTVEDASVETVDVPAGRKDVEIAFERDDRFHVEEGVAVGVYYEPGREQPEVVHVDWQDDRDKLTLSMDDVIDMTEGEYYVEG